MKNLLLFALFFIAASMVSAQNVESGLTADQRIYDFYPSSKIDILLKDEPQTIIMWNAILKNGIEIIEITTDKKVIIREVEIEDIENINILAIGLYPLKEKVQYFKIKNTTKLLMIKSEALIKRQNNLK